MNKFSDNTLDNNLHALRRHRFVREIKESLPNDTDKVLVTVSGGADSVALLVSLSVLNLNMEVAHCNFHLRGDESERDKGSVEKLCLSLKVPLHINDFNVNEYLKDNKGCSVEMACRNLRYEWFRTLTAEIEADRIVTGHNADDNIETLLLNLFRGSGTAGLKAMQTDNGEIWRPLLKFSRAEILEFLNLAGITYVTDSSNLTSDYRRNFLRNEVLPLLRTRWPGLNKSLTRTINNLNRENKIVANSLKALLADSHEKLDTLKVMKFADPESAVRRYIEPLHPFATTASEIVKAINAGKSDVRTWNLPLGKVELRGKYLRIVKLSGTKLC